MEKIGMILLYPFKITCNIKQVFNYGIVNKCTDKHFTSTQRRCEQKRSNGL